MEQVELEQSKQEVFALIAQIEGQNKIVIATKIDYDMVGETVIDLTKRVKLDRKSVV